MRIAIISDIHGNISALSNVLEDAEKQGVTDYIFVGDYIFDLPFANEVVDTIRKIENAHFVQGNKEVYLCELAEQDQSTWNIDQIGVLHQTFRELSRENREYLMAMPETCRVSMPYSGEILVTHFVKEIAAADIKGSLLSSGVFNEKKPTREEFLSGKDEFLQRDKIKEAIQKLHADVVIQGHTHLQWHGYCSDTLMLNAGSCGLPLDGGVGGAYTILEDTPQGLKVEERRVWYDIEPIIEKAKKSLCYEKGKIWMELVFMAMRDNQDGFGIFFELAQRLAEEAGESGNHYSNETWNRAGEMFFGEE